MLNTMVMRSSMIVRQTHWLSWLGLWRSNGGADSEDEFLPLLGKLLPCRYQLQSDPMPLGSVGGRTVYFVPSYFTLNFFSLTTASKTPSSQMTFILPETALRFSACKTFNFLSFLNIFFQIVLFFSLRWHFLAENPAEKE